MKLRLFSEVLDRIYPSDLYCVSCGKIIDWSRTYHLCDDCMKSIKWATDRNCAKCGKLLGDNNPSELCFNCREHNHKFDRGFTCAEYGAHCRAMVFAMKYDGRPDIAKPIGEIMSDRLGNLVASGESEGMYDLLVPVPVSRKRHQTRGYNQAALVAETLSENTGIPYYGDLLRRKDSAKMKGLTPEQRRANIQGLFEIRGSAEKSEKSRSAVSVASAASLVNGANCLVIDDIYTTGATVDEISRVLKDAGAERVDFLSFASGADMVKS